MEENQKKIEEQNRKMVIIFFPDSATYMMITICLQAEERLKGGKRSLPQFVSRWFPHISLITARQWARSVSTEAALSVEWNQSWPLI